MVVVKMKRDDVSVRLGFEYIIEGCGESFDVELKSETRHIMAGGKDGLMCHPHGRWETFNHTLYGWFNFEGPGHRPEFFSVTWCVLKDGKWALVGFDENQRRICMLPQFAQRGDYIDHDGREVIKALFGWATTSPIRREDMGVLQPRGYADKNVYTPR